MIPEGLILSKMAQHSRNNEYGIIPNFDKYVYPWTEFQGREFAWVPATRAADKKGFKWVIQWLVGSRNL